MKSLITKCIASALLLSVVVAPSFAQQGVNQRERHQQRRIDQGIASGQLTPRETRRLERRERRINRAVRRDRFRNGGTLTPREHARIERRLNRTSGAIYRKKHNAHVM